MSGRVTLHSKQAALEPFRTCTDLASSDKNRWNSLHDSLLEVWFDLTSVLQLCIYRKVFGRMGTSHGNQPARSARSTISLRSLW